MTTQNWTEESPVTSIEPERYEFNEGPAYSFDLNRRQFVQVFGAGLLVTMAATLPGQEAPRGGGGFGARSVANLGQRLHIGADGIITVMSSKVEVGQGARTELTQAAAEEFRVSPDKIKMILGDTELTPEDGGTFGSQTTPSTVPTVRRACAAAREVLIGLAAVKLGVDKTTLVVADGKVTDPVSKKDLTYGELVAFEGAGEALKGAVPAGITLTKVEELKVLGQPILKVNGSEVVTGKHQYPSDMRLPGMLYGAVLRPPTIGGVLRSADLAATKAMTGVVAVQDGDFVGCAAPTRAQAEEAVRVIAKTAQWDDKPTPSSKELFGYLKAHVTSGGGGGGRRGGGAAEAAPGAIEEKLATSTKRQKAAFEIAYIQHAPMEPRAAFAELKDGKLTVWTATQGPGRVAGDLARAMRMDAGSVRVIVPDSGGGFGGKHTGECALEAARLAKATGKPVLLRWTREEEFRWAYFRPAGLIEAEAGLDSSGAITAWTFTNYNSGGSAVATPYAITANKCEFKACDQPLRSGSYRGLAATANVFAREAFMDELAAAAGVNPLEFRVKHLQNERLKAVLVAAAEKFGWPKKKKSENHGFGIACGTEKGSFAAACAEVEVNRKDGSVKILRLLQAYECGKILNPDNLLKQVEGSMVMALGGAMREEIRFENGKVLNPSFTDYFVPRFKDVPPIEVHLLDRPDLPSAGAGETPIVPVAPAIANAIFDATGVRVRSMPIRYELLKA